MSITLANPLVTLSFTCRRDALTLMASHTGADPCEILLDYFGRLFDVVSANYEIDASFLMYSQIDFSHLLLGQNPVGVKTNYLRVIDWSNDTSGVSRKIVNTWFGDGYKSLDANPALVVAVKMTAGRESASTVYDRVLALPNFSFLGDVDVSTLDTDGVTFSSYDPTVDKFTGFIAGDGSLNSSISMLTNSGSEIVAKLFVANRQSEFEKLFATLGAEYAKIQKENHLVDIDLAQDKQKDVATPQNTAATSKKQQSSKPAEDHFLTGGLGLWQKWFGGDKAKPSASATSSNVNKDSNSVASSTLEIEHEIGCSRKIAKEIESELRIFAGKSSLFANIKLNSDLTKCLQNLCFGDGTLTSGEMSRRQNSCPVKGTYLKTSDLLKVAKWVDSISAKNELRRALLDPESPGWSTKLVDQSFSEIWGQ